MSVAKRSLRMLGMHAKSVVDQFDENVKPVVASAPVQCGSKVPCNGCCRQLVTVSLSEAAMIVDKCRSVALLVKDKLERNNQAITKLGSVRTDDPASLREQLDDIARRYWALQLPCAFLADDGTCRIYAHRPLACRAYYSMDDPAACYDLNTDRHVRGLNLEEEEALARGAMMHAERSLMREGSPVLLSPLSTMVSILLSRMF